MALQVSFSVRFSLLAAFAAFAYPAAAQAPPSAACETLKMTGRLTPENIRRYGCDGRAPASAAPGKKTTPGAQSGTEAKPWRVERSENGTWVRHGDYETDERAVAGAQRACVDRGSALVVAASRVRHQGTVRHQYECIQSKAVETKPSD